jgi:hypothetical protein
VKFQFRFLVPYNRYFTHPYRQQYLFLSSLSLPASSPFTDTDDEEEAVDAFFEWKKKRIKHENTKAVIKDVCYIVLRQMWSLEDLRKIEDFTWRYGK